MKIASLEQIGRTYRQAQRYRHILLVLSKYGFNNLVNALVAVERDKGLGLLMFFSRRSKRLEQLSNAERSRLVIEELGPTYIKMGQVLSTRRDLLSPEFINELSKLQNKAPSFPFSAAKQIVEAELKQSLDQLFARFDELPIAAASFGQVHRARLVSGEEVAVKVQRPNIKRVVESDMEIMLYVANLLEKQLDGWSTHRPTLIVQEFRRVIEQELDYTIEMSHLQRFSWQFEDDKAIHVPKVYRRVSTQRVLTMEWVEGINVNQVETLKRAGMEPKIIAKRGFDLILKQIFYHGFFHADPHPGNVLILPDNLICYLDFGMMGRIDIRSREACADLLLAVIRRDEVQAANVLLRLTVSDEAPNRKELDREVANFMDQYAYRSLSEIQLGPMLHQLLEVTARHNMRIPPDLFLMMKAMTIAEGIGRQLDPTFDPIEQAKPFIWRLYFNRLDPRRLASDFFTNTSDLLQVIGEIPVEFNDTLKQLKRGRINLQLTVQEIQPILSTLDRISNRLSFAIVLAALLIGSSLIINANMGVQWNGMSIVGLFGFILAGVMGFGLLIAILRRGMV